MFRIDYIVKRLRACRPRSADLEKSQIAFYYKTMNAFSMEALF
jgi:hypothetical protein